jgi:transcriptional regulator of acetoin/glycerol metabolism
MPSLPQADRRRAGQQLYFAAAPGGADAPADDQPVSKVSHTFAQMSSDDPETRRLIHFGRQAARGGFPVLLCGEEGVGKELVAQAIHNESERAGGPYIAVNCQLYADSALGQDFMGSAPTDDENGRLSRLELASGGTLFLENRVPGAGAAVRAAAGD